MKGIELSNRVKELISNRKNLTYDQIVVDEKKTYLIKKLDSALDNNCENAQILLVVEKENVEKDRRRKNKQVIKSIVFVILIPVVFAVLGAEYGIARTNADNLATSSQLNPLHQPCFVK